MSEWMARTVVKFLIIQSLSLLETDPKTARLKLERALFVINKFEDDKSLLEQEVVNAIQ